MVSDNYFRSISGLPPAPYLKCQPSQAALEQNSPEYLTPLAQLEVNSVKRLLEQSEMYQDGSTASNMSTPPVPQGSTTPVTMDSGFHPIGETPLAQAAQSTQVSHTQALNMLESQSMAGSIVWKLTPIHMADQCVVQHGSSADLTQGQPVIPVSFASTTQVRLDTAIPLPAGSVLPQVISVWVPLSQITSVASTSNVAPSFTSHQTEKTVTSQNQNVRYHVPKLFLIQ